MFDDSIKLIAARLKPQFKQQLNCGAKLQSLISDIELQINCSLPLPTCQREIPQQIWKREKAKEELLNLLK